MRVMEALGLTAVLLGIPAIAQAQDARRQAIEASGGYAVFVDEAPIHHSVIGGAWLWQATPRIGIGPELVYMRGPGSDRDLFLTGKVVMQATPDAAASLYFVADGGVMFHRAALPRGPLWVREGAVSFGGGVRINVTDNVYVAPEVRIGWELHARATVTVGWRPGHP